MPKSRSLRSSGKPERLFFTARQRRAFYKERGPRCWYCGRQVRIHAFRIEHQIPLSKGGTNKKENLVMSCILCDKRKDQLTLEEYRSKLSTLTSAPVVFWGEVEGTDTPPSTP